MRYLYSIILLLFTFNLSSAQEELLLGQWYVDHLVVDNMQHNNYYNEAYIFDVTFTSNIGSSNSYLSYEGKGSCNSFSGDYTVDDSTITIHSMNITLVDCVPTPRGLYEQMYIDVLGGNIALPNTLNYTISNENNQEVLTVTNPNTGDYVVYGKVPREAILVQTWYLSHIETPGNPTIYVPTNEVPTLVLTNDVDPISFRNLADGYGGECNSFSSEYDWSLNSSGDYIQLIGFSQTLADCGATDYEDIYFEILGNITNNYSAFEISEDGSTLTLTDLLGAQLIFGDVALSIDENKIRSEISLKKNPITTSIELNTTNELHNAKFEIISIQGQIVKSGKLKSNNISTDELNSGLYFLSIKSEGFISKNIKFIKK
ncbi:META domain-containing protein [Psychroserpens sp. MEBiC05023]